MLTAILASDKLFTSSELMERFMGEKRKTSKAGSISLG